MGKKCSEAHKKFDQSRRYEIRDALQLVKDIALQNSMRVLKWPCALVWNPRHADQMVRGM